jgi:transposase
MVWDDWGMAKRYRPVNRDQLWLLPPDPREWLPAKHPVYLVIDVVEHHLDTSAFHAGRRTGGPGAAGYDPDMLVTVLVWAYANGVVTSRRIEELCRTDLAFRVICAGNFPDHVTFSEFRKAFPDAAAWLFAEVLALCARLGMGRLGVVTLDGTKLTANASKAANRTEEHLARLAEETVARHGDADAAEDALFGPGTAGDQVPGWSPRDRDGRIAAAAASLRADREAAEAEAGRQASQYLQAAETGQPLPGRTPAAAQVRAAGLRLAQAEAAQAAKVAAWQQRRDEEEQAGTRRKGPGGGKPPSPPQDHFTVRRARAALDRARAAETARQDQAGQDPGPAPVRNITDPDSRLMPVRGGGFTQGYNGQNAVSEDVLVIGADVTDDPTDTGSFEPMLDRIAHAEDIIAAHRAAAGHPAPEPPAAGGGPGYRPPPPEDGTEPRAWLTALFVTDAGYCSEHNINAPGPPRLIATGKHRDLEKAARNPGPAPPAGATPLAIMTALLQTEEGITAYRQRSHQAETPHGHIKHNMGIRQLTMRGKPKATAEWNFITAVYNLCKAITSDHLTTSALAALHHRSHYPPAPAYQPAP